MAARILIVDDEPNISARWRHCCAPADTRSFSAMSGRAALEAVERDKPDLIVLDLGLPDIDGVEVCRQVRQILERADPGAVGARRGRRQGRARWTPARTTT